MSHRVDSGHAEDHPPPPVYSRPLTFDTNPTFENTRETDFIHSSGNTYYNKSGLNSSTNARKHGEGVIPNFQINPLDSPLPPLPQEEIHVLHQNQDSSVQDPDPIRRLDFMTKALIERANRLIEKQDCDGINHFAPEFTMPNSDDPQAMELDFEDWKHILRPLLNVLNKLLRPSNINSLKAGYCQRCQFFQITHDILTFLRSFGEREDPDVEKYIKALEEIMSYGESRPQKFDMNFGRVVFGSAIRFGILLAILAHLHLHNYTDSSKIVACEILAFISVFFV